MKKLLLAMVLMPLLALADKETVNGIEWTYTVKDGKAEVSGATPATGSMTIPSTLGGCPVTSIGERAFDSCNGIASMIIHEGVVNIECEAFSECSALKSVTIPNGVTNVGSCAFLGCRGLESITVPEGVTSIGSSAFFNCRGLRSVVIPPSVKSIEDSLFYNCCSLQEASIPPSVTNIGFGAFYNCSSLTSIVIPPSVICIRGRAFNGCSRVKSFSVDSDNPSYSTKNGLLCSKSGTTIVAGVNGNVRIPPSVKKIGHMAFGGCGGLTSITVDEANAKYRSVNGMLCSKDGSTLIVGINGDVTISTNVTVIARDAFSGFSGLTSVKIPSSVMNIGGCGCAFEGCGGLKCFSVDPDNSSYCSRNGMLCSKDGKTLLAGVNGDVTIPDGVTSIGDSAFRGYSGLTSVKIPEGVTSIERYAFGECEALTTVMIPSSVKRFGYGAFFECSQLNSVTIPSGVTSIEESAFAGCCGLKSVTIPSGVTRIGRLAFADCTGLTSVTISSGVKDIRYHAFSYCGGLTSVTIPSSVTNIGEGVFYNCSRLASVTIPSSVTSIGKWEFYDGFGTFQGTPFYDNMPDGMVVLGGGVLYKYKGKCPADVVIPTNITSICEDAFRGCAGLESVTIPASVMRIGRWAFGDCRMLKSVTIPSTLKKIDRQHFPRCPNLKTINVVKDGKVEAVPIDDFWKQHGVAQKLQECEFLINGQFKKNAKVYLCLFSASWCGPCRREMPRIAKTYAEALQADPDIELIHFSRDRDESVALAWAKEHDVKFPVVKPNGGNPLNLQANGIPHLFIVRADGKILEQGHPSKLFTVEKLRTLVGAKGRAELDAMSSRNIKWTYEIVDGGVMLGGKGKTAVAKETTGTLVIPAVINGKPVRGIGDSAFLSCSGLTAVKIPSSVTNIGMSAFSGCSGLKSIIIPEGVTSIEDGAFSGCRALTSVTIPSSVTNIGREAFLAKPQIYNHVPKGGWSVRRGNGPVGSSMVSFSVAENNPSYSSRNGMLCSKDGSILISGVNGDVTIPEGMKSIDKCAFSELHGLTSAAIASTVTNIGFLAFNNCKGLKSVTIPPSVTSIEDGAFSGTPFYDSLPDGMVILGSVLYAYKGKCPASVTIPSNVVCVGSGAFAGCSGLKSVTIPSSVKCIESGSFGSGLFRSRLFRRRAASEPACGSITSFSVDPDNPLYCSTNGLLCTKDMTTLVVGVNGDVTIPEGIKIIGKDAFFGRSSLMSVKIPPTVTNIGEGAFCGCEGLTAVTIPSSVMTIGNVGSKSVAGRAFANCSKLVSLTIPSTVTNVHRRSFEDCPKLKSVDVEKDGKVESMPFEEFAKQWKLERPKSGDLHLRCPAAENPKKLMTQDGQKDTSNRRGFTSLPLRERRALRAKQREEAAKAAEAAKREADAAKNAEK